MAGHSHWAGIKHKKGKADKIRSKIFSKLSREITVAAKLGDKDPDINPRLRSAIQSARSANMPKDNFICAIQKSELIKSTNFENIRYEGFGPHRAACIVETLTDNKNRTASNIRTLFHKNGGSLGTQGSVSHSFSQTGVIRINQNEIDENSVYELVIEIGVDEFLVKKKEPLVLPPDFNKIPEPGSLSKKKEDENEDRIKKIATLKSFYLPYKKTFNLRIESNWSN